MIKELRGRFTKIYGFEYIGIYDYHAVTPRNTPISTVYEYLRNRYSSHCSHGYDCCGCPVYSYQVTKISRRNWRIKVNIGRNY
jgi:hypothetical protein